MNGDIMLAMAMLLSLSAMLAYVAGYGGKATWGKRLTVIATIFIVAASANLWMMIFQNRFDIAYVANYYSAELSPMYKVSAFWAGQQGSFLLWLLIHAVAGLFLCYRSRMKNAGMIVYLLLQSVLCVLVIAKSPFEPAAQAMMNGHGLNPLLEDPWMAIHPPVLFVGYALMAVPFAYSAYALISGDKGTEWLESTRKWALAAWAFLGAGIFIGGYWAYKVLGWGGFWGWDPVENSSLVPWLLSAVFIHLLAVSRVRKPTLSVMHLSIIFVYASVLYGTFLTRSGILGDFSVHSFSGSSIGLTIAVANGLVLIAGLLLLMFHVNTLPQGKMYTGYNSREFLVLLGMLLTVFIAVIIFLGMSMPMLTQLFGRPASVDTSFYVRTTMPLAIVLMLVLTCACIHRYGDGNLLPKTKVTFVAFVIGAAWAFAIGAHQIMPIALAGASGMAAYASVYAWRHHALRLGGMVAHVGLGLAMIAMVLAGSGSREIQQEIVPGNTVDVLGHTIAYQGQEFAEDGRSKYYVYTVDGSEVKALTKLHASGEDAAREPAIARLVTGDVYIAPVPPKEEGREEMILKRGHMQMDEDYAYRYDDVRIEPHGGGSMLVTAEIAITDGDTVEHVEPTIIATMDGGNSHPIEIYGGAKRIRLTGISSDNMQARIEVLPSVQEMATEPVTAKISTKPFIWLLWLSACLVVIGMAFGIRKS